MKHMTFTGYQEMAAEFRGNNPIAALGAMWTLGLCGEAGEVAEKIKKLHRDGTASGIYRADGGEFRAGLTKELGDVLWYLSQIARDFDIDLQDVAAANLAKLRDRTSRGVMAGSGDAR